MSSKINEELMKGKSESLKAIKCLVMKTASVRVRERERERAGQTDTEEGVTCTTSRS